MNELAKFDEVKAAIAKFKKENENLVFDYEDAKGNKDARSHIYKLRQTKTVINAIHKEVKAEALAICQKIDKQKRDLIGEVEEMIEVHAAPIKAIEEREAKKIADKLEAERLEAERLEAERKEELRKREEEVARREEAARKAEEERQAKIKAEEDRLNREREKLEAEKQAEADARRRVEEERKRAEIEKQEALKRAEEEKEAAIEAERERIRREEQAKKAEEDRLAEVERKRIANKKHREKIQKKIYDSLYAIIFKAEKEKANKEKTIKLIIEAIDKGEIDNIKINY